MRGELDWIALKALEKDRNRRYEAAAALGPSATLPERRTRAGLSLNDVSTANCAAQQGWPPVRGHGLVVGTGVATWQAACRRCEQAALAAAELEATHRRPKPK